MKSLLQKLLLIVLVCLGLTALAYEKSSWAEVTARITPFYDEDHGHGYTVTYDTPESTAVNQEGHPIKGPIEQHVTGVQRPLQEQDIQLLYLKAEPVIYKWTSEPKVQE